MYLVSHPNIKNTVNMKPRPAPAKVTPKTKAITEIGIVIIDERGRDFSLPSLN
jgi:hypothetical protein